MSNCDVKLSDIFQLMLQTAQFELKVKEVRVFFLIKMLTFSA